MFWSLFVLWRETEWEKIAESLFLYSAVVATGFALPNRIYSGRRIVTAVERLSTLYVCARVYVSTKPLDISSPNLAGKQHMISPGHPFYLTSNGQMSRSA